MRMRSGELCGSVTRGLSDLPRETITANKTIQDQPSRRRHHSAGSAVAMDAYRPLVMRDSDPHGAHSECRLVSRWSRRPSSLSESCMLSRPLVGVVQAQDLVRGRMSGASGDRKKESLEAPAFLSAGASTMRYRCLAAKRALTAGALVCWKRASRRLLQCLQRLLRPTSIEWYLPVL